MAQAYTPGLKVVENGTVTRVRELPIPGKNLVQVGDLVSSNQEVLRTDLPGEVEVIRIADRMGLEPIDVVDGMLVKDGDKIEEGQLICQVKTFFGLFTTELHSPTTGVVEFFTDANAHMGIRLAPTPLSVDAYVSGKVAKVEEGKRVYIEANGTFIQGIFGVGGERQGRIKVLNADRNKLVDVSDLKACSDSLQDTILIGGAGFTTEALSFAATKRVEGVVTGSIDASTLKDYVGYEIGVTITGDEKVPFSLIVTEGFGDLGISERVLELAKTCEGLEASINGATQVRAGAMRPEIIVPKPLKEDGLEKEFDNLIMEVGSQVRVIRVPYFGKLAVVTELPSAPEKVESGAVVRVLRAKLASSGEEITVPRANVELV